MLSTQNLKVYHGPIEAVHGIDISIETGQVVSLLGSNGAGKTSTLSAITGTAKSTGDIIFDGQNISKLSIEDRFKAGIALAPEGRRIFGNLSVLDNLVMGASIRKSDPSVKAEIDNWLQRFPILGERRDQAAGTLSGGEQQMLAIARGLLSRPKIFLMDEPSLGLAPQITEEIFAIIRELKADGITILLVEQNATKAISVSDYVYVLSNGVISHEGAASSLGDGEALMNELTGVSS